MNPKLQGILATIASLATAVGAAATSGDYTPVGPAIGGLVALLGHSPTDPLGTTGMKVVGILGMVGSVGSAVGIGLKTGNWIGAVPALLSVFQMFSQHPGGPATVTVPKTT